MVKRKLFGNGEAISCIGMIHLLPLPGSPEFARIESLEKVIGRCTTELEIYLRTGVHGVIIENYGDAPFYPGQVHPETVASMTRVISESMNRIGEKLDDSFILGVNVLRNDAKAAIAIAHAIGADFIRLNIHDGVQATDQGFISGMAHETLRYRASLGATEVRICADVRVKHATPIHQRSIMQECKDLVERGRVDGGLIFTGSRTGTMPSKDVLKTMGGIKHDFPEIPLLVGSGVTAGNIIKIVDITGNALDGVIVGTAFKKNGNVGAIVDENRVKTLLKKLNRY